jgi:NAD(P)H-hydrate epimerase
VVYASPERRRKSHKGDYGRLLVIGGSRDYVGTPTLVAEAALRVGVDLVFVAVPQYVADKMPFNPNLIVKPLTSQDYVIKKDVGKIDSTEYDAVVVGNGMGRNELSRDAVEEVMSWSKPTVVDADAITLIEKNWIHEKTILTPHGGEFKRLFGELDESRIVETVKEKAGEINAVVVLKGETDVISNGETTRLNKTGNPYMTVGGTGDVLAGIIGGLVAQNKKTFESACAGVFLTGLTGDIAAEKLTESLTATDVINTIPDALNKCRSYLE